MGHKHCLCLCPPLRLRGRTGVLRHREGYLLATLLRVSPSASSTCSVGFMYEAYPNAEVRCLRVLLRNGLLSLLPRLASFEEGLGRIMFVAGALEHERPFLGPLYRFISVHPKESIRRIPQYVKFILRYFFQSDYEPETLSMQFEIDGSRLHAPGGCSGQRTTHRDWRVVPGRQQFRKSGSLDVDLLLP